jgi:hypothetical protein
LPYDWERLVVYAGAAIPAPNQPGIKCSGSVALTIDDHWRSGAARKVSLL